MALVINTNVPALNAQRNLGINNSQLGKSLERLSSGLRINRAADDAAGLAIATKFQGQVKGLSQAVRNVNNAVSLVQTAEAGISTLTNILQRLRELAVQSSSDDNTSTDRSMLTSEANNLISEFSRVVSTSEFNTMTLLDGTFSGKYFQVGANYSQLVTFNIGDLRSKSVGGRAELDSDVADGVLNAVNANFGGSEFKINAAGVAATSETDDQYSVIDLSSTQISSSNLTIQNLASATGIVGTTTTASAGQFISAWLGAATVATMSATYGTLSGVTQASALAIAQTYFGNTSLATAAASTIAGVSGVWTSVYAAVSGFAAAGVSYTVGVNSGATLSYQVNLTVNGVAITVAETNVIANSAANAYVSFGSQVTLANMTSALVTAGTLATDIVSAINNNASLAALNITARTVNTSGWVLERKGGGNLTTLVSLWTGIAGGNATTSANTTIVNSALYSLVGIQSLVATGTAVIGNGGDLTAGIAAYNGESSAIAKTVAINAIKNSTGVIATARKNDVTGTSSINLGTINSGDIYLNGINLGAIAVTANDGTGALVSAINANSTTTGVTATTDANGKLMMTAADGRNITITAASAAAYGYLGLGSGNFVGSTAVFRATVRLNSEKQIDLTGSLGDLYDAGTGDTNNNTKTADSSKSQAVDLVTFNVSKVLVDTQANAQAALLTIDKAFNDTNLLRSQIGAIQNRLEFTVANLESASENFSASESRIRDADFAAETGKLTRNQILVQAGTAMLAQANQLSQLALQLLK